VASGQSGGTSYGSTGLSLPLRAFFSVEVWTARGLRAYYVLFIIELSIRKVEIAGITPNPDGAFMAQIARNLVDCEDGFLRDKRYLMHDRDGKYTPQFIRILRDCGMTNVKLPRRSPNLNAFA
jgi:putative transposase